MKISSEVSQYHLSDCCRFDEEKENIMLKIVNFQNHMREVFQEIQRIYKGQENLHQTIKKIELDHSQINLSEGLIEQKADTVQRNISSINEDLSNVKINFEKTTQSCTILTSLAENLEQDQDVLESQMHRIESKRSDILQSSANLSQTSHAIRANIQDAQQRSKTLEQHIQAIQQNQVLIESALDNINKNYDHISTRLMQIKGGESDPESNSKVEKYSFISKSLFQILIKIWNVMKRLINCLGIFRPNINF